jgi:hypothetical protein
VGSGIPAWWSFGLAGIGVFGLFLTTRPEPVRWWGYGVGLAIQFLWVAYALATGQAGFLLSALAYGAVNLIGLRRGRATRTDAATEDAIAAHRFSKRTLARAHETLRPTDDLGPFAPYQ